MSQQPQRINIDDPDMEIDESETVLYRGVPFTGEAVETDSDDGTIVVLNIYLNGREEGIQREFYRDGDLRSEYQATDGHAIGVSRKWHPNGQLAIRKEFDEYGKPRKVEKWDESGAYRPDAAIDSW